MHIDNSGRRPAEIDQKLFKDPARVRSGRNCAALRTASLQQSIAVRCGQIPGLSRYVCVEKLRSIGYRRSPVIRRRQMRANDRSTGDPVSRRPALARYLEATFFHHALQEAPYSGFAHIPRNALPDGIASSAWILANKVENVLIRQGHETISRKCETIRILIHLHVFSSQVFVSRILQRLGRQEAKPDFVKRTKRLSH